MVKKSCDICDNEKTCFETPVRPDADKCDGFSNPKVTRLLGAINIVENSEWLKEHDEQIFNLVHQAIDSVLAKNDFDNPTLHMKIKNIQRGMCK